MLERITIILFKPIFMAKYLPEKIVKTLFYFFIMVLVALLPTICLLNDGVAVSKTEYQDLEAAIRTSEGSLVVNNGKIVKGDNFYLSTNLYTYAFSKQNYENYKFNVIIENDTYNIYAYGIKVAKGRVYLPDMEINQDASNEEIALLTSKLYNIVYDNNFQIVGAYVIMNCIVTMLEIFVMTVIFYFLGCLINPIIKGRFKWTLVLYSMFPYLLLNAFGGLLGWGFLSVIGLFYTYFVYYRALKAIVKIEVRKGE